MIEFVFAASPETIRSEASGDALSFAQSATCRTWQPARCVIPFLDGGGLSCGGVMALGRHKRPLLAIDGEQIRHHLSSYRQRRAIRMPFLFSFSYTEASSWLSFGPSFAASISTR
jgi:hypothetical protein